MVAAVNSLYGFGDNFVFRKDLCVIRLMVWFYLVLGIYQLYLMKAKPLGS